MFDLTIHKPKKLGDFDSEDSTVSEAIYSIYPIQDGTIVLNWNGCEINLALNSLSDFYTDIVNMLESISLNKPFTQYFLCSAFTAEWLFDFQDNELKITAHWISIGGGEATERKLHKVPNVIFIKRNLFISLWDNLLQTVMSDLYIKGYRNLKGIYNNVLC